MMEINEGTIQKYYVDLNKDTEAGGYHLNPDLDVTKGLIEGLMVNENRYGYPLCPCRLTSGSKEKDLDIICPCDYRDPDVLEYGTCFCGLYVSQEVVDGKKKIHSIPERRPSEEKRGELKAASFASKDVPSGQLSGLMPGQVAVKLAWPIWRCNVCGYICARENPPEVCPVCKAKKERFSRFL